MLYNLEVLNNKVLMLKNSRIVLGGWSVVHIKGNSHVFMNKIYDALTSNNLFPHALVHSQS